MMLGSGKKLGGSNGSPPACDLILDNAGGRFLRSNLLGLLVSFLRMQSVECSLLLVSG
jgi:hypothetical protein